MDVVAAQNQLPDRRSLRWTRWLFAAALVAAVFLAYMPSWHGGFLGDDDVHLLNNPVLKPSGLAQIWVPGGYLNYWPLTYTAYWFQFQLWGLQPLGFHLVNLALHALAALLVWQVLARLRIPGAMFAAAIFALHPVNVESVAWIAQLKGILSLALALVSVLFYLANERHPSGWRYCLAIAAFLLSALAKGAAVTLPVVLLACAWWQRGRIERRDWLRVVPYLLIGAAMAGIELWTQHNVAQREVVRTDGLLSRGGVAGCAVWFYLGELIWPVRLCPIYPRWTLDGRSMISYMPSLISAVLLVWAWWKRRSWGRPVVMSIVCYVALVLPILGFANIYFMRFSLVSDHWQYIATIVPCALFAAACSTLARRFVPRPAAIGAGVALLSVLAVLSFRQSGTYRDSEAFYETTIACNPDCWLAYNNLGTALLNRGDYASAIADYQKSLALNPNYAAAHYNLGNALLGHGQVDSAIAEYKKAIEADPNYAAAHNNLAAVLAGRGDLDSAIAQYQKVLELQPRFAEAHNNLGNVLLSRGQTDSAIANFQKALELDPNHAAARKNLAKALAGRSDVDLAVARSQAAMSDNPNNAEAHFSLANALFRRGEIDSAIAHYQRALEIKPDFAAAHANLATALAAGDDFDSAIAHYRAALKIEPDNKLARNNLGVVVSAREDVLNKVAEQREAVRLHPDDAVALNNLARTLATNPNASIRSGGKAVELAERAAKLSGGRKPSVLNTLAAAYAEAGRFSDAVQTTEQAERLASAAGDRALAEQIRSRLELYRSGKPFRQPHGE